ncbi:MAG: helix-turn-helix domain-containing protein [Candidatus Andersenbacteria bacterium]|nr:helix-turn-helix domain-containing protein [bacterium]MDZ4225291.1 helix-turn-helix domain-containing protein [Candidatus Andersenbacteria bacterium]
MVGTRPCRTRPDVTVGRLLEEARRRSGKSCQEVAREIRVPAKHLAALENGDLSVFTAEIYARGAFAQYAKYLGIYAEQTQRAFQRVLCGAREFVPLRVHRPRSWLAATLTPRWILAAALFLVALSVGSYVAWQMASFVHLPDLAVAAPAGGVVTDSLITLEGRAAKDAEVTVNDEQVLLDSGGSFTQEVRLHPGINILRVAAKNGAGRVRVIQKDVLLAGD